MKSSIYLLAAISLAALSAPLVAQAGTKVLLIDADLRRPMIATTFEIDGDSLMITLRNTSPSTSLPDIPARTLSGLFWELINDAGITLTPVT